MEQGTRTVYDEETTRPELIANMALNNPDTRISFEGAGKRQLLAILKIMPDDFRWKLEIRSGTGTGK